MQLIIQKLLFEYLMVSPLDPLLFIKHSLAILQENKDHINSPATLLGTGCYSITRLDHFCLQSSPSLYISFFPQTILC